LKNISHQQHLTCRQPTQLLETGYKMLCSSGSGFKAMGTVLEYVACRLAAFHSIENMITGNLHEGQLSALPMATWPALPENELVNSAWLTLQVKAHQRIRSVSPHFKRLLVLAAVWADCSSTVRLH
jgi:hypothetical protein